MYRMTIFIQDAQSNHTQQANLEKHQWKHVNGILKHLTNKEKSGIFPKTIEVADSYHMSVFGGMIKVLIC